MSRPFARLTLKMKGSDVRYSIFSVWSGADRGWPDSYSIKVDVGTEKYPVIGLFKAIDEWLTGNAYLSFNVSSAEPRGRSPGRPQREQSYNEDPF